MASCAGILTSTANGNTGADSLVNILAHEIAETVTDYDDAWNEGGSLITEIAVGISYWETTLILETGTSSWGTSISITLY